jgi:UDP-3-O-acyl-N-acetylglucosamine deacetylase
MRYENILSAGKPIVLRLEAFQAGHQLNISLLNHYRIAFMTLLGRW